MGYEGGMHEIRDKDARDSGQLLHFGNFFVSLHCHSSRTANGKLTTKKRRGKRQGCTPAQSLSKC